MRPIGKKPSRKVIRAGRLDDTLERFNGEVATKTGLALAAYDKQYVAPLRERIAWLELPWYGKAYRLTQAWLVDTAKRIRPRE